MSNNRAILIGLDLTTRGIQHEERGIETQWTVDESLDELAELALTAGVESVGRITQKRPMPDGRLYIGEGKLEEAIKEAALQGADLLIFDDELEPSQIRNIEKITQLAVLDRTQVILDIFASRAMSREGQIQVELAQLTYLLPRLRGSSENLSRLGGGIGTRGPGETKLETDLRRIRSRISDLRAELKEVVSHRELLRKSRTDAHMPMGALVGYTNAGKSTLFNKLTGAQVLAADMLFATLDPTTRKVELPSRRDILLSDTVGFIKKLPHHLIAAFKATLEEVVWADFLLHVVDTSNLNYESQITAVEDVLQELNVTNKPVILVLNKIDKLDGDAKERVVIPGYKDRAFVSLRTEEGYQELISTIERVAFGTVIEAEYLFGYDNIGITQNLRSHAVIISEEYVDKGLLIKVRIDNKYEPIYKPFKVD